MPKPSVALTSSCASLRHSSHSSVLSVLAAYSSCCDVEAPCSLVSAILVEYGQEQGPWLSAQSFLLRSLLDCTSNMSTASDPLHGLVVMAGVSIYEGLHSIDQSFAVGFAAFLPGSLPVSALSCTLSSGTLSVLLGRNRSGSRAFLTCLRADVFGSHRSNWSRSSCSSLEKKVRICWSSMTAK